jgi:hypothetical protein
MPRLGSILALRSGSSSILSRTAFSRAVFWRYPSWCLRIASSKSKGLFLFNLPPLPHSRLALWALCTLSFLGKRAVQMTKGYLLVRWTAEGPAERLLTSS